MAKHSKKELISRLLAESISLRDARPLRTLLDRSKIDPNKYPEGSTMLHAAVQIRDINFLHFVLTLPGASVGKKDKDGRNAIEFALSTDFDMAVELLNSLTQKQMATTCPFQALIQTVKPAKRVNSNTKQTLHFLSLLRKRDFSCLCHQKHAHDLMSKLNAYVLSAFLTPDNVNEASSEGKLLLVAAAELGHLPTVRTIVMRGARTWDDSLRDICSDSSLDPKVRAFISQFRKRKAVFYILKFRDAGAPLFSMLSFWLIKEIIALI